MYKQSYTNNNPNKSKHFLLHCVCAFEIEWNEAKQNKIRKIKKDLNKRKGEIIKKTIVWNCPDVDVDATFFFSCVAVASSVHLNVSSFVFSISLCKKISLH